MDSQIPEKPPVLPASLLFPTGNLSFLLWKTTSFTSLLFPTGENLSFPTLKNHQFYQSTFSDWRKPEFSFPLWKTPVLPVFFSTVNLSFSVQNLTVHPVYFELVKVDFSAFWNPLNGFQIPEKPVLPVFFDWKPEFPLWKTSFTSLFRLETWVSLFENQFYQSFFQL